MMGMALVMKYIIGNLSRRAKARFYKLPSYTEQPKRRMGFGYRGIILA